MKLCTEPKSVLTWGHTQVRDPFKTLLHALLDWDARSTSLRLFVCCSQFNSFHFYSVHLHSIQSDLLALMLHHLWQSVWLRLDYFITRCGYCCSNTFISIQTSLSLSQGYIHSFFNLRSHRVNNSSFGNFFPFAGFFWRESRLIALWSWGPKLNLKVIIILFVKSIQKNKSETDNGQLKVQ